MEAIQKYPWPLSPDNSSVSSSFHNQKWLQTMQSIRVCACVCVCGIGEQGAVQNCSGWPLGMRFVGTKGPPQSQQRGHKVKIKGDLFFCLVASLSHLFFFSTCQLSHLSKLSVFPATSVIWSLGREHNDNATKKLSPLQGCSRETLKVKTVLFRRGWN